MLSGAGSAEDADRAGLILVTEGSVGPSTALATTIAISPDPTATSEKRAVRDVLGSGRWWADQGASSSSGKVVLWVRGS
jgi:hypothetical protein